MHEALPLPKGRIHSGLSGQALAHWRQWGRAGPHVFTHLPCSGTCSALPLPSVEVCLARSPALHPDVAMLALKSGSRCPSFSPGTSTSWEQVSTSFLQRAGQGMLFSFSSPAASVPATGVHHSIAKAATEAHEWMSVAVCHHSFYRNRRRLQASPSLGIHRDDQLRHPTARAYPNLNSTPDAPGSQEEARGRKRLLHGAAVSAQGASSQKHSPQPWVGTLLFCPQYGNEAHSGSGRPEQVRALRLWAFLHTQEAACQ